MQVLAVSIDPGDDADKIRRYQDQYDFRWPMALTSREMLVAYGVRQQSTKFAIDADGIVTYTRGPGNAGEDAWKRVLETRRPAPHYQARLHCAPRGRRTTACPNRGPAPFPGPPAHGGSPGHREPRSSSASTAHSHNPAGARAHGSTAAAHTDGHPGARGRRGQQGRQPRPRLPGDDR